MSGQAPDDLDRRPIRQRGSRWARIIARWLASAGISPNAISILSVVASIGAGAAFYATTLDTGIERLLWLVGAFLIFLRLLANMFDGMVAVEWDKATPAGALYNEAPDRISDAVILIGAGYSAGGGVEFGYIAACLAIFIAYVRVMARNAGAPSDYGGPMAKQQRMFTLVAASVYMAVAPAAWHITWSTHFGWGVMALALLIVVVGGVYTVARRLWSAARFLNNLPE